MNLISCENVTMAYAGRPAAVSGASFNVDAGDYLCVVGENGSGKSTLAKGLLGLLKPLDGKITYNGIKRHEIGYLPQQTVIRNDFPASVHEVVLSGCLNRMGFVPFYTQKCRERAEFNLKRFGIENIKNKKYRELSGGQRQRVLLARALCAADKMILLDEPVSGLDPVVAEDLYSVITKLNKEQNVAVVMISHDIKSALKYGNKILHLETAPVFFGYTKDYLNTDRCRRMIGGA